MTSGCLRKPKINRENPVFTWDKGIDRNTPLKNHWHYPILFGDRNMMYSHFIICKNITTAFQYMGISPLNLLLFPSGLGTILNVYVKFYDDLDTTFLVFTVCTINIWTTLFGMGYGKSQVVHIGSWESELFELRWLSSDAVNCKNEVIYVSYKSIRIQILKKIVILQKKERNVSSLNGS